MQLSILDVLVKKTEICLDPYWENRCVSAQIPVRGRVTCLCCLLLMDIELGGRRWSVMTPDIADLASRDHRSSGYISGLRVGGYLNANKCLNVPSRFPTAHWLLSDFVYSVSPPCRGAVSARVMMINHRYWTRGAPLHRALPGAGGEGRRGGGLALSVADRDGSRHQPAEGRHPRYAIIMVSHLTRSRYSGCQWENFQ